VSAASPRRGRRSASRESRGVEDAILGAMRELLVRKRFEDISVADILEAAGVSRASFYFYFESRHAVLAVLVRQAVQRGHEAAQPWLTHRQDDPPMAEVRRGIEDGARLWRDNAPVLRAIVESWRSDPELTALWLELMDGFTRATEQRIAHDRDAGLAPPSPEDLHTLASLLTWVGERAYYLAAIGQEPFDDEQRLIAGLTDLWRGAVYRLPSDTN
jgi:TetR/AcrR family transcriptional regulator, ethionamide resistance regulator